ncbi:hypothetical protein [Brucella anthropi]
MLIDDRNLMRIAGYAAAAAFLGAASLGFPKPVLSWFALLGVAIVAALLVRSPELVDRLRFQEASSIVLVSALATVMGEGLWLEIFGKRGKFGGQDPVSDSKSEILNTVHIVSSASIFHGYGIPDFGKS